MLDKSLTYYDFIMKMPEAALHQLPEVSLPGGYRFELFNEGDEHEWARLEASVLEFPSQEKALGYFNANYRDPFLELLKKRSLFIKKDDGRCVATATAWFMPSSLGEKGWLQWISTDPAEQGKGLGKAVVTEALKLFLEHAPGSDIFLHTQTWSYKAIAIYHKLGFQAFPIDHVKVIWENPEGYRIMHNDVPGALEELKKVFPLELLDSLRKGTIYPAPHEGTDLPEKR